MSIFPNILKLNKALFKNGSCRTIFGRTPLEKLQERTPLEELDYLEQIGDAFIILRPYRERVPNPNAMPFQQCRRKKLATPPCHPPRRPRQTHCHGYRARPTAYARLHSAAAAATSSSSPPPTSTQRISPTTADLADASNLDADPHANDHLRKIPTPAVQGSGAAHLDGPRWRRGIRGPCHL